MENDDLTVGVETTSANVVLITVGGSLDDWSDSGGLTQALARAARTESTRIIVDLSGVTFADSTALHIFLDGRRQLAAAGIPFVLAGPLSAAVSRLFEVTGLRETFTFADSVEQAHTC
ncbi:STAS domain-containing protein [Streptomyces sp. NPDC059900]|uniref:STAS domain-containing protein n=1 Tax=Streptomyces sp. NPDC059900 TaxID=3155816 RepID=UPI003433B4B2